MQHEALQKVESEQNEFIEQFILQKWLEIPGKNPIHHPFFTTHLNLRPQSQGSDHCTTQTWCTKSPEHGDNLNMNTIW